MSQRQHPQWKLGWSVRWGCRICQKEKLRLEKCRFYFVISQHHWPTNSGTCTWHCFGVHVCSPSHLWVHMGIFFLKKIHFGIISDLQRSCKDGWKSSHVVLHPAFPMLTSDLTTMHLSELRNARCYDLNSRFYSDFNSVSTYVLFPRFLFSMVGWCGVCGQGRASWPSMGWILWLGYSKPLSYIPLRKDQEGRQAPSTTTCNFHRHLASL